MQLFIDPIQSREEDRTVSSIATYNGPTLLHPDNSQMRMENWWNDDGSKKPKWTNIIPSEWHFSHVELCVDWLL
jgi:hypothetical protein